MNKYIRFALIPVAVAGAFYFYSYHLGMRHADLAIFTQDNRTLHFNVEIAETSDQGKKGLQGRTSLKPNAGMLFLIPDGQIVWMWMKDTQIPVDMIFIAADHTITKIVPHNKPLDETPVQSDGPAAAILEIGDGLADANFIHLGDKVDWPK